VETPKESGTKGTKYSPFGTQLQRYNTAVFASNQTARAVADLPGFCCNFTNRRFISSSARTCPKSTPCSIRRSRGLSRRRSDPS
jgi:hypothetical protein